MHRWMERSNTQCFQWPIGRGAGHKKSQWKWYKNDKHVREYFKVKISMLCSSVTVCWTNKRLVKLQVYYTKQNTGSLLHCERTVFFLIIGLSNANNFQTHTETCSAQWLMQNWSFICTQKTDLMQYVGKLCLHRRSYTVFVLGKTGSLYWCRCNIFHLYTALLLNANKFSKYFIYYKQQRAIRPLKGCNIQECIHDTMLHTHAHTHTHV